jgi:UDP-N-acetylglucosamine 4,6-dehydratase
MKNHFKDKTILITGGTGSFGNAVAKKLLEYPIKEIRIFSRDEKKQEDMRIAYADPRLKFYIGDVRFLDSIDDAMFGVDYVFHAAALKQVPSCEFYPMEAVQTNILGADNVMRSAFSHRVAKCVVLSTDKAVYPINAMGMSKALMEKAMIARSRQSNQTGTIFCATRYGNVMASRGSVIPLFIEQILAKTELTITDPEMTRFLMSLDDSVNLVFYAFLNAKAGDIFVQKAPASTVRDLAIALKDLFGDSTPIKYIGTRHGEKLFETLVSREEMSRIKDEEAFFRIPADSRDLNYSKYFTVGEHKIELSNEYTSHNTKRLCVDEIKDVLLGLDLIRDKLNG